MPYTIEETKTYQQPVDIVFKACQGAVDGLEGKVVESDPKEGSIEIRFHKTIHGKVLGDRTHMFVKVIEKSPDESELKIEIFPTDAVGRKLQFGARKGVARTVLNWYFAHIEHRLKP